MQANPIGGAQPPPFAFNRTPLPGAPGNAAPAPAMLPARSPAPITNMQPATTMGAQASPLASVLARYQSSDPRLQAAIR
jgi:hypothetical protein